MIDVIGTDAGAPASLPSAQQALIRAADQIAAPQRLQPALHQWLADQGPKQLISSDDPRALAETLRDLPQQDSVVVLSSGDPLRFGIGRSLLERLGSSATPLSPGTDLAAGLFRIGRSWRDASWVSLPGSRRACQRPAKRPAALAVLTDPQRGGAETVQRILRSSGLEASTQLWLCENLGHADERVHQISPGMALPKDLHPLLIALLIAEEPSLPDPQRLPLFGLDDGVYLQHADHPD